MAFSRHLLVPLLTLLWQLTAPCRADVSIGYITHKEHQSPNVDALVEGALQNVSVGDGHLLPLLREVRKGDPVAAAAAACSLADEGVAAILDGGHTPHCEAQGVPCLSTTAPNGGRGPEGLALTLHMEPQQDLVAEGTAGLLRGMRWFTFSFVYDNMDHLGLLEPVLSDPDFRVKLLRLQGKHSYTTIAQSLDKTRGSRVVLALEGSHLRGLLNACSASVRRPLQFLVATPHARVRDLADASSSASVMGVRLGGTPRPDRSGAYDLDEMLLLDAVETLDKALQQRARDGESALTPRGNLCAEGKVWDEGEDFFRSLVQVQFEGRSGLVAFDSEGFRTDFSMAVVGFSRGAASEVMRWTPSRGVEDPKLITPAAKTHSPSRRVARDLRTLTGGRTPTLRIAAVLSAPYVMYKEQSGNDTEELFGNDRFEGFSVDLMDEIAQEVGFNYILDISPIYGTRDPQTGEFTGVIGDLVNQRVDAVIGDITVNENRESVVDFTDPWFSFGISLLVYHTRPTAPAGVFDFLTVFAPELWGVLLAATLGTALLLFFLSRVSPFERIGSADQEPQTWTPFTLCYSAWFACGTCFRQFIYFQPRAPSTRVLVLVWWLVVILVAANFVANLSAKFTLRGLRSVGTIKSVYDLPDQNELTYSSLYGGSTWAFFRDSESESLQRVYSVMYNRASERRILSSAQGIEEVLLSEGSFGFLMEEPSLEYVTERNCDLKQLGGPVGSRDYAIALQQDSPYLDYFNDALYTIRESGQLQALRNLWWRHRRGGGKCASRFLSTESAMSSSMVELDDFTGPFLLLAVGACLALVMALLECCYYAAASANSKGSDVGTEMSQQVSQAFTTSPSSHLPYARQARL